MKKQIVLTAAGVALLAGCGRKQEEAAAPVPPGKPEYCAVAEAYLKDRLGRLADKTGILVTDAPPQTEALVGVTVADMTHRYNPGEAEPYGWPQDPPAAALAEAWIAQPQSNALAACEGLDAVVREAGVELVSTGERPRRDDQRLRIAIALPMVDEAQTEALLMEVGRVPGGGGADVAVHLRKGADGAWKETDNRAYIPGFEMPKIPDAPPPVPPPPAKK